ncbi:DUF2505 domain-containing protein [Mycolicibacterium sp. ND9-15]|uniref:DUF2505 domain-containing protein n=1 Tax=Mycolicibacterium sp. ND9-15 TaxID=3042320 RepID=UPI002DDA5EB9|nr:DUF2505 domain-containing protein [Mycolicibacterium sp. ND9-15]WSE57232.1 DUF2505 domain-containing protein [Mycolicibacterium sp. ND9-15]
MAKSFDCTVESSISIQQMHAVYCERDYWLARLAPHSETVELRSFDVDAGGTVRVTVVQNLRDVVLPPPFGKLYPRGLELVQNETWAVDRGDSMRGEFHVKAHGAPGSGRSTILIAPARDGERLDCNATIKVKVPLVGGKLESLFGRQIVEQIPETLRSVTEWLGERA